MKQEESAALRHDPSDYTIRWSVSIVPLVIFLAVFVTGIAVPDLFKKVVDAGVMLVMKDMGWFVSLCSLFFVGFCLLVAVLPIRKIRLGGPNAKPNLTTFEYFALRRHGNGLHPLAYR